MFMKKFALLAAAAMAVVASAAHAQTLVDTGPGSTLDGGYVLSPDQGLAGKFTLADAATIGSIEGYIGGNTGSALHIAIYSDGATPGSVLFSDDFTSGNAGWQGISGEHWNLDAGSYWAVFTSTSGYNWMSDGAPNPLAAYSGLLDGGTYWTQGENLNFGVRVDAASGAVPEPASWALMLGGFGLVGGAMRSRRKAAVSFG